MGLYLNYFCLYFQFCIAGWSVCNLDLMRITYCFVRHIKSASANSQISYLLLGIIIFSWYNGATFSFFICCMLHGLKLSLFLYYGFVFNNSLLVSCLLLPKKKSLMSLVSQKKESINKGETKRRKGKNKYRIDSGPRVSFMFMCRSHVYVRDMILFFLFLLMSAFRTIVKNH